MSPSQRVILFIDYQNIWNWARRHYHGQPPASHIDGQIDPLLLGEWICTRPRPGSVYELKGVRVYTGRPHPIIDSNTHRAHMNQCARWESMGIHICARPLQYSGPRGRKKGKEKGIDVLLAVDLIALAAEGEYDIGVIASADTDLVPALDYILKKYDHSCRLEVTAWLGAGHSPRLNASRRKLWCHWMKEEDYNMVRDYSDYRS